MRLLPALLAVAITVAVAPGVAAGPTPVRSEASTARPVGSIHAATYRNPLVLALPDGGRAESCADPVAIHGRQAGDRHWYLYCTSDPLSSRPGAGGQLEFHNIPTFSSTDLVHWTYAGDAFPTKPAWLAPTSGIWAPEVVYRNGRYYLYYAAPDTALPGGGSAIGVATSAGPTGPWVDSGGPVVAPQDAPDGGRRWEFDPEVVTAGSHTYLYFGSYFGGIFARELTADGLTSLPATETRIAIDNRYEATTIVKHDGWYYFMGSSANCCNGPLTGYSVFTARSRNPLGPFLDRSGRSILAGRVGGTPVLHQNGNRWVGAGHNTVITDFAGQDWTIYHAVDRTDPYFAGHPGFTKRPALIDPLDWRDGWPVARGGAGPSDRPMPAPAAQPGQHTSYDPEFVRTPQPGRRIAALSDNFDGSSLSAQWNWTRPPATDEPTVAGGGLNWPTQAADLHPGQAPLASVLTEPAPAGDYLVETRVAVDVPAEGCCQNFVQGGVLIYGDDGNYVKLASVSIWNTRQTEFGKEVTPVPAGYPNYGNSVGGPVGDWTYLRIVHHRLAAEQAYTAYTSLDGRTWDNAGTWTADLGSNPRIGLVSMGGSGFTARFDYVKVSTVRPTGSEDDHEPHEW